MNEKHFIARSQKQIENINTNLEELRNQRNLLNSKISNLENIRELLKFSNKQIKNKEDERTI